MKKIFFLFILLISLGACRPSSSSPDTLNPEEAFLIARNQVGPVKKGMTIKQLRALLPDDQMKKLASRSELSAETADNYYIYDDSTRLLFIVSPRRKNDETSRISQVIIKDHRFTTRSGIGLTSTVGEIRNAYPDSKIVPSINDIILYVRELDANFELDERYLSPTIWNDTTGNIQIDSIPASTEITDLTLVWTYDASNITDKLFWNDLIHHLVNWIVTQVPAILLLILIFIGLLRLLRFIVKKIRESATERLQKLGFCDYVFSADATQPVPVMEKIAELTNGEMCDITINNVNITDTEMTSILCTKDTGLVYFFSMATSFTKAALGAEGVGSDVTMLIGNGYTRGHAEITLQELRESEELRKIFTELYA